MLHMLLKLDKTCTKYFGKSAWFCRHSFPSCILSLCLFFHTLSPSFTLTLFCVCEATVFSVCLLLVKMRFAHTKCRKQKQKMLMVLISLNKKQLARTVKPLFLLLLFFYAADFVSIF